MFKNKNKRNKAAPRRGGNKKNVVAVKQEPPQESVPVPEAEPPTAYSENGIVAPGEGDVLVPGEEDVVVPGEDDPDERKERKDTLSFALSQQSDAGGTARETWGSPTEFLMSCIAAAVGLGNVWRFPAVCAKNGGATFLIPYFVVLLVIGRPLFVLELSLGQFSSKGSVRCWDMCPALTGIGLTGMVASILLSTFYIMLMAWSLIYSLLAIASICYKFRKNDTPLWTANTGKFFEEEIIGGKKFKDLVDHPNIKYWIPRCHLVLALIFAWLLVWCSMAFGVKNGGKIAYVTALLPYVVLITLLIVGFTLDGMTIGLKYMYVPVWRKLLDVNTWYQAVGQCFFSLGVGFGGCIMFASFNPFRHNIIRDVMILGVVDSITSLLAGTCLLSIMGFKAKMDHTDAKKNLSSPQWAKIQQCMYDDCLERTDSNCTQKEWEDEGFEKQCALMNLIGETGGAGLAFVHYPSAMNGLLNPGGAVLALMFFIMLIALALGSANGFVGTTVTIISDRMPRWKRSNIVSGVCFFSCLLGMIYTNDFGAEWFDVVDLHGVTGVVYALALMEVFTVVYIYGLKNWNDDLIFMLPKKPGWYFLITWPVLPFLLLIIYIYWMATYKIKPEMKWTPAIIAIGWTMTVCCLMIIPGTIVYKYFAFKRHPWNHNVPLTFCSIMSTIFKPFPRWGPKDPQTRHAWKIYKAERDPSLHLCQRLCKCKKKSRPPPPPPPEMEVEPQPEETSNTEMQSNPA